MGWEATLLFYLLAGAATAAGLFLAGDGRAGAGQVFRLVAAWLFWPLFLPLLLERSGSVDSKRNDASDERLESSSPLAAELSRVERELDSALASIDGWAGDVFAREEGRIRELKRIWWAEARRVEELDRLLSEPGFAEARPSSQARPGDPDPRLERHEEARRQNVARLHELRRRTQAELLATLARVRELVSTIHLAHFTGASATRAEELVEQIAAAVEALAECSTWEATSRSPGNPVRRDAGDHGPGELA